MQEPEFTQHPTEIFGHSFVDDSLLARNNRQNQFCPFLDGECKKPRKSEPHIKVGVCTVGYRGNFLDKRNPVIVCPHRLKEKIVYETIENFYFNNLSSNHTIKWASEVSCGVAGHIDFVAAKMKRNKIEDFLCVEFQAAGTTGTPWQAVVDFKKTGKFSQKTYKYGINWANEFAKTMMQQVYKKGMVMEYWNKKIVFVLQDVGLHYIQHATDASDLREASEDDLIHFCIFKTVWNNGLNTWRLAFDKRMSTNTEGIRKILGGAHRERFLTLDEFKGNINARLASNLEGELGLV